MQAIITVGVSGCGKTTWATKQKGFEIVSRDDIRDQIIKDTTGNTFQFWNQWDWRNEDKVTEVTDALIAAYAANKQNIIIADTNLNKGRVDGLKHKLTTLGYDVQLKFFHGRNSVEQVSIEDCLKRDVNRVRPVGSMVIHKQWKQMIDSYGDDIILKYRKPKVGVPSCIIVDIDGTIANHEGIRSPFDWAKVGNDKPIKSTINLVEWLSMDVDQVVFLSGRDGVCRSETFNWLKQNTQFDDFDLFMRAPNDSRKDSIVKLELFDRYIRYVYNVHYVIDDRKQVVQMWTDLGLNVINVGHINDYF
jgi:predicted kinase